jgi:hypothetical protein
MGGRRAKAKKMPAESPQEQGQPPAREKAAPVVLGIDTGAIMRSWDCAKGLFDPGKAVERLRAMPYDDGRLAIALFFLGGLVIFALWFLSSVEYIYVLNFEFQTLGEISGEAIPQLEAGVLIPIALFQFTLWGIFALVLNLAHEGVAFFLARLTGGTGTLGRQMCLSSIVWLAVSMSMAAVLLGPLYLLCAITLASLLFVTLLYLGVFMTARAYSIAHDISLSHAAAIVLLLVIPRLVILAVATDMFSTLASMALPIGGA